MCHLDTLPLRCDTDGAWQPSKALWLRPSGADLHYAERRERQALPMQGLWEPYTL